MVDLTEVLAEAKQLPTAAAAKVVKEAAAAAAEPVWSAAVEERRAAAADHDGGSGAAAIQYSMGIGLAAMALRLGAADRAHPAVPELAAAAVTELRKAVDAARPSELPAAVGLLGAVHLNLLDQPAEALRLARHVAWLSPANRPSHKQAVVAASQAMAASPAAGQSLCPHAGPTKAGGPVGDGPVVYLYEGALPWLAFAGSAAPPCGGQHQASWLSDLSCLSAADAVVFDCPDEADRTGAAHPTAATKGLVKPAGQLWVLLCAESSARFPALADSGFLSRFDLTSSHSKVPRPELTSSSLICTLRRQTDPLLARHSLKASARCSSC